MEPSKWFVTSDRRDTRKEVILSLLHTVDRLGARERRAEGDRDRDMLRSRDVVRVRVDRVRCLRSSGMGELPVPDRVIVWVFGLE